MKRAGWAAALVAAVLAAALYTAHRRSDGPLGPLSGGPLRSGERAAEPDVDWSSVIVEQDQLVELELVATGESRLTGAFVYQGRLYVPCDLGFVWRRAPKASFRALGFALYAAKH